MLLCLCILTCSWLNLGRFYSILSWVGLCDSLKILINIIFFLIYSNLLIFWSGFSTIFLFKLLITGKSTAFLWIYIYHQYAGTYLSWSLYIDKYLALHKDKHGYRIFWCFYDASIETLLICANYWMINY